MADGLVVVWRVTEACNLACGFCKYDRRLGFPRRSAKRQRVLALGEELARFQRESGAPVHVSFLGGEPLLWPPFAEVVRVFHQDLGLGTGITTNGTALGSRQLRSAVLDHVDELTLSIDGFAPFFDVLRGWPGGFAALERTIRELAAERRRPLLRANVVLMRDNVTSFPALCRALVEFGIDEITLNQLGGRDRPEFFAEHRLSPEDVERIARELPKLERVRGAESYVERLRASALGRKLPVADCSPGQRFLFLDEDGIASPCSFTEGELAVPLALGDLPRRFRELRGQRTPESCGDCPSTRVFGKFSA